MITDDWQKVNEILLDALDRNIEERKAVLENELLPPSTLVKTISKEYKEKSNTKTEWREEEISDVLYFALILFVVK